MNRKKEQAEIMFKVGQFFGPLLNLAQNPQSYDRDERFRMFARFAAEESAFHRACEAFFKGEPGHSYNFLFTEVYDATNAVRTVGFKDPTDDKALDLVINAAAKKLLDVMLKVPTPTDSAIYEARTPFTTYCFVKDLCSTVTKKIVWLDRYFDHTVFHRFFTQTPMNARITLVTWPASKATGGKDKQRVFEFMDISKLFAAERGPQGYRLVENDDFHDRWLRCDSKLFTLGGSIKDLNKTFTISKLDSTPENTKHFDEGITQGTEIFGPNQPNHP